MSKKEKKSKKDKEAPPHEIPVDKLQYIVRRLNNIASYQDVGHCFMLLDELKKELQPVLESKGVFESLTNKSFGFVGVTDLFGWRPNGTQFWNLFPNPFGIFAYLAENHWAIQDCRACYRREILDDGFRFVGNKKNFAKAKRAARALNLNRFRAEIADHFLIYGACWLNPQRNGLGGIKKFTPLLPQYIKPIPSSDGQRIVGWQYQQGSVVINYTRDQLMYGKFRPSHRHYDLSSPALGSVLVDIEADLQASMYNNVVFQKGGLLGMAVLLEKGPTHVGNSLSKYAQQLQAELSANHAGARAGFEAVVFENTKDVKVLNDLASLDGAFHKTSDKVAKQIAHVLGVPHEFIGIITNSNQQYHAARLTDYDAAQFDKSIGELMDAVDYFINTQVLPKVGITDVKIQATRRYNSLARTATQSGLDIGSLYGVMSVNEYRTEILKLPPIEGGDIMLQKLPTTAPTSTEGAPMPYLIPPPMPSLDEDDVIDETDDLEDL